MVLSTISHSHCFHIRCTCVRHLGMWGLVQNLMANPMETRFQSGHCLDSLPYQWYLKWVWLADVTSFTISLKGFIGSAATSIHPFCIARAVMEDQSNMDIIQLDQAVLHYCQLVLT